MQKFCALRARDFCLTFSVSHVSGIIFYTTFEYENIKNSFPLHPSIIFLHRWGSDL